MTDPKALANMPILNMKAAHLPTGTIMAALRSARPEHVAALYPVEPAPPKPEPRALPPTAGEYAPWACVGGGVCAIEVAHLEDDLQLAYLVRTLINRELSIEGWAQVQVAGEAFAAALFGLPCRVCFAEGDRSFGGSTLDIDPPQAAADYARLVRELHYHNRRVSRHWLRATVAHRHWNRIVDVLAGPLYEGARMEIRKLLHQRGVEVPPGRGVLPTFDLTLRAPGGEEIPR